MTERPKVKSSSEKELDKAEEQFKAFEKNIHDLNVDTLNQAPKLDLEPSNRLSQQEISESRDIYLKPYRSISSREKFNEDYRSEFNFKKEYVYFIAENHEVIGEDIDLWTKPFAGMPAEEWKVPTNKPIWAPRYVAERIKECKYHVMAMAEKTTNADSNTQFYGQMVVQNTKQRLDALPATKQRSIFMGAGVF